VTVLPYIDVEELVVAWLATVIANCEFAPEVPDNVSGRFIQAFRLGGPMGLPYDRATVVFNLFAPDRVAVNALAAQLTTAVEFQLPGFRFPGAVVSATEILSGPSPRPNPNTNDRRLGMTARLHVKPA
jgi:hypothetical protein